MLVLQHSLSSVWTTASFFAKLAGGAETVVQGSWTNGSGSLQHSSGSIPQQTNRRPAESEKHVTEMFLTNAQ